MTANANLKKILCQYDFSKIPPKNLALPHCTSSTRPENPVAGQVIYEKDTGAVLVYNGTISKWTSFSNSLTWKGTVGGNGAETLVNLPEDPDTQDVYVVCADGDYGPTGSTQHAQIGDYFFCTARKTQSTAAKWFLVPSGNGRLSPIITIADGTSSYSVPNTLGTANAMAQVFDSDGIEVICGVQVTANSITVTIDPSVATVLNGETLKVVILAG